MFNNINLPTHIICNCGLEVNASPYRVKGIEFMPRYDLFIFSTRSYLICIELSLMRVFFKEREGA